MKSLKTLKKGINKLRMIRLFICQTYNSCKIDKKNQYNLKDTLKLRKMSIQLLHNSKSVLLLVQKYY